MDDFVKPVAYTLTTAAAAKQHLEWVDLQGHAIARGHIENGVAMTFDLALTDRIEALTAREIECCSFLSLDIKGRAHDIRLKVVSKDPAALPTLHSSAGLT
jgi:hypothetical protein